ncbi:hypothetical protein FVE85_6414 [Porphyridium purpureum]|uniref:Uncharacterized protein n=1 Tax=Porphyridium purpureum TaxID=35688 RepID=A0A5J4Z4B6_PORPP|nr:hypothetical protein FVE85_6414 [Porphyridium purpureum]|eukprot:POR6047..scf295_1
MFIPHALLRFSFSSRGLLESTRVVRARPRTRLVCCALSKRRWVQIQIVPHFDPVSRGTPPCWYDTLAVDASTEVSVLRGLPYLYDSNSKRWERVWLEELKQHLSFGTDKTIIIAHGSGADALLRLLEEEAIGADVRVGVVLIAPTTRLYHAGERHPRSYRVMRIAKNVGRNKFFIVYSDNDPFASQTECEALCEDLYSCAKPVMLGGRGRFMQSEFIELRDLVHKLF